MVSFKKFFSAPSYPDEETNRRAGLLSFILNLHILVALSTTLVFILFLKMPPIFPLAAFLSSLPGFGLRATLWRGYVKQSAVIFVSMVILIMPLLAWFSGYSVATVPVTVFQCITVLMAGLILGRWGAAIFVASTSLINGILIYAELHGIYSTDTTHNPILAWSMQIVAFSAIASMLYVTNRLIGESFMRAQKENDQRRAREQELEQVIQAKSQAETELKKSAERLEILHDIDRALLSASSPQVITTKALARIRQLIPCPRASVTLFDFNNNQAIFLAVDSDITSTGAEGIISLEAYGQYVIDELQQNKPCIVNDSRTHPSATELDKRLAADGLPAWLYLPLLYQGQLIGALNLGRTAENFFTTAEAEIAFGIANQLAVVIRQSRLNEALQNELIERKQTEEKLINSEARLRAVVENSPDLILEIDRQGKILFINRYAENYLGKNVRDILPPDQINLALEIIDKSFDTGQLQSTELQTINPDGQMNWDSIRIGPVKQGHRVTSLTIIMTDITIKKQTEDALHRSEHIYRQAITTAGAVPYYRDHRTNTYTFMGEGILAMTGYSASEMTPELWETLEQEGFPRGALGHLTYEEADRITEEDSSLLWECDYRIRTRDGQTRWVADTSVKGYNEYGERVGVIGILQDITERKQAEAERETFIQELEAKNAELERFNYTVSHELKSPIVTIKGFLGSIAKDIREEKYERAQKDLLRVSNATDKMHDTLSDLLELSRIGRIANPPEEVDLAQLTREALETVHGRLQARNVTIQIAPDLPVVCGDRVRLREVFENLIDNAAKHFGDQPAPLIEIGVRKDGDENVYFIKDNGLGIDAKYHKRIFGLFDKLDATSEGTGIGLAIVKRIIETHGGRIWVESDGHGKGSTFCFTIPGK